LSSIFLIAINPSNIYSSPADEYEMQEKARKAKWNLWRKCGNAKLKFTGVNVNSTVNFCVTDHQGSKRVIYYSKNRKNRRENIVSSGHVYGLFEYKRSPDDYTYITIEDYDLVQYWKRRGGGIKRRVLGERAYFQY
jgi:hypothetical protein